MKRLAQLLLILAICPSVTGGLVGQESDRTALLAFAQEPLRFDSFCFSGDKFPSCQFENPRRVEQLIGPYKLNVTFYDAAGQVVTAPRKEAGRYAAIVEIERRGRLSKRFFTLYHLAGNPKLGLDATGARLALPKGTGIDPAVVKDQTDDVDAFVMQAAFNALKREPAGAALLAGLHDLSELKRAGKATYAGHPGVVDEISVRDPPSGNDRSGLARP